MSRVHRPRADLHVLVRPTAAQLRRRLPQLFAGIVLLAVGIELTLRAELGLAPWDVLHQGIADHLGVPFGLVVVGVGLVVLLLWIPLRQPLGLGTVLNTLLVGVLVDLSAHVIPSISKLPWRWTALLSGLGAQALGVGLYIGAGLGTGPRDGLMTAIARRGAPIALVRTALEVSVLAIGWTLGGTVGIGTVILALGIGPLSAPLLHRLHVAAPATSMIGSTGE